jgi:bleomycin hydrolase
MRQGAAIALETIGINNALFNAERANVVAKNAVTSMGVRKAARVPEAVAKNTSGFDIEIKQGDRTDQKQSGRCWMFASLNTFRQNVIDRFDLKTFELSQAYPLYYDKLEKANWFLVNIIDTVDEPLDGRLVQFLLTDPVADGGQWDMFYALVKKYGVVPKEAMPEVASSSCTRDLDKYLTRYLRGCAKKIRDAAADGKSYDELDAMRKDMMDDVQTILTTTLGQPPVEFDVRLRDKNDKIAVEGTFTPQKFFEDIVDIDVDELVSVISANTQDKPFYHTYTVERLGNVVEQGGVKYINLPIDELKRLAIAQMKDGRPVWFGCDVDQAYLREEGIMDTASLDIDGLFGVEVENALDREARLDYGESVMTHAMVLEGVNLDMDGKPTLWKVENSWGKDRAKDGFDSISDAWFDQYVYQVVVDKKYLTDAERDVYDNETPTVLAPWDPMGALAD